MFSKSKSFFLFVFWYVQIPCIFSQDQKLADSLITQFTSGEYSGDELEIIKSIAFNETYPERKLEFSNLLIEKATVDSLFEYLHSGFLQKGNALRNMGDLVPALEAFFESINYANRSGYQRGIGALMISIADTYSQIGNVNNAETYYNNGIKLLRETSDSISLAIALLNAGDEYLKNKKYSSALDFFEESGLIFKNKNYLVGTAYNLGNIGMVYAEQGKNDLAKKNINQAISILEEMKDYHSISTYLMYMSDIYAIQNDVNTGVSYAQRSLELATLYGLKEQISKANLQLSELYEQTGDLYKSYNHYKQHIRYRDSIMNIASVQQMADLRTDYEVSQKQAEVDLLEKEAEIQHLREKRQRNVIYATGVALVSFSLLALGLYRRYHYIKKTKRIIEEEKLRSENLLLNILPEETAFELKQHGKVKAKKFESVSVLFTDFKGFTQYAENLAPEKLVETVDFYFSKFDEIIEKYKLEKIKTIGDSYMCAGGLPFLTDDHAEKIILAAFEIADFVKDAKTNSISDQTRFDIRIGINTGPVVAGVVGSKKFAYDIWGHTVNIASRMESNSEPGKINVSQNTYELIKEKFDGEYRGEIKVKNKGLMKMYFIKPSSLHYS